MLWLQNYTAAIICNFSHVTVGNSTEWISPSSEQNKLIYYDAPPSSGQIIIQILDRHFTDQINFKIIIKLCQLNWLKQQQIN